MHQDLEEPIDAVRAKRRRRLPLVMTRDRVQRVLAALSGTHQLMAKLLYGAGLGLMECVRLRVKPVLNPALNTVEGDVNFARRHIVVRD